MSEISHNIPEVVSSFNHFAGNVRYASARAMNDLVKDVQQETMNRILPDKFTLRAKGAPWYRPGNRFGFNGKFATKENLSASVGSQADWLKLQEEGGTKQKPGHRLAIPSTDWKPKADIMAREKKPRAILDDVKALEAEKAKLQIDRRHSRLGMSLSDRQHQHKIKGELSRVSKQLRTARKAQTAIQGLGGATGGKAFIAKMRSGFVGIFKRMTPKSRPLKLLFSLTGLAKIEPRLHWEKAAQAIVDERYDERFKARLTEALNDFK
jgi:hypothetical protein